VERAVWIVHGDAQARAALARMAGLPAQAGGLELSAFASAPTPGAIVLHVPLSCSEALAFAHTASARHPRAHWLLAADPAVDPGWLHAAFAGLRFARLPWPLQREALQRALQRALAGDAPPLAARRRRDALAARFARTLGDVAIPERVQDASGHLAVTGERGTGKLLLARTLHALWDAAEGEGRASFVLLAGEPGATAPQLESRLGAATAAADRLVVCVEDPAAFPGALQRELASWIELGVPGCPLDPTRLLWILLRPESFGAAAPLEGPLAELCEAPALRIPPLRERPGAALQLAEQWLRDWSAARGEPVRALAPSARAAIAADPWPGNARELEAALRRAAATPGGPIEAEALELVVAPAAAAAVQSALDQLPRAGDARDFDSVIEELDAARADEAAGVEEAARHAAPERRTGSAEVVDALLDTAPAAHSPERAQAASPASREPTPPAAPGPDLRAFARAAARELAPALDALRARTSDPAALLVARRLARLEQFADLDAETRARTEVAPLLAALLAERRDELTAKRVLVLRELESDDTHAYGNEAALRFAFSAVLDTLLEAAPPRTDLYVSARATLSAGARPIVRAELRLRSARTPDVALDLALARDLLTRLGATLALETDATETRATIDLAR
jgi:DNA-binding NtrC family response regulator